MQDLERLLAEAKKARLNAYTPYSNFKVGAAILLDDGKIISGCNVENASYGLTNCAERTTLFKMISEGYRRENTVSFLIIGDTKEPISPCGACRQVMSELLKPNCKIYLANLNDDIKELSLEELLPYGFKELV